MINIIETPHIAYYFRTQNDISNGLMGVRHLAPDSVALFDMGRVADHKFYMKNTVISLDIIFMNDDGLVVGTLKNMEPFNETSRSIGKPSRYVIEAPSGYIEKHDIIPYKTFINLPFLR